MTEFVLCVIICKVIVGETAKQVNKEEINISRKGTSDELYRELLNELGRYVYVVVFNKLRSCGTKEDVEEFKKAISAR